MNPVELDLDLNKAPDAKQRVFLRQGERLATVIRASVYDDGEPVDLSEYDVYFEMRHPRGAMLEDDVTQTEANVLTYTVSEMAAQEVGTCDVAYFALRPKAADSSLYATTQAFIVIILPNAQCDGNKVAEAYSSEIERMLEWCRNTFLENEEERDAIVDAAAGRADAAAQRANDAADKVEQALKGDLGAVFDVYLDSKKDVSGGFVAYETYQTGIENAGTPDEVTITKTADKKLAVKDGGITPEKIADLAEMRGEMGLGNTLEALAIENGGTGCTTEDAVFNKIVASRYPEKDELLAFLNLS